MKSYCIILGYWPANKGIQTLVDNIQAWNEIVGVATITNTFVPIDDNSQINKSIQTAIYFEDKSSYHLFKLNFDRRKYERHIISESNLEM